MSDEKKKRVIDLSSNRVVGGNFSTPRLFRSQGDQIRRMFETTRGWDGPSWLSQGPTLSWHHQSGIFSDDGEYLPPSRRKTSFTWQSGATVNTDILKRHLGGNTVTILDGPTEVEQAIRAHIENRDKRVMVHYSSNRSIRFSGMNLVNLTDLNDRHRTPQHHVHRMTGHVLIGAGVLDTPTFYNSDPYQGPPRLGDDLYWGTSLYDSSHLNKLNDFMRGATVGWWAAYDGVLFVSHPPKFVANEGTSVRLHSERGPAVTFRDGTEVYAINGVVMSKGAHLLYMNPDHISINHIMHPEIASNEEVRRLLINRRGLENLFTMDVDDDSWGRLVAEDEYGKLYDFSAATGWNTVDAFRVVIVENFTPEPDGTRRKYALTVPSTVQTPKEGVAWTYGFSDLDSFTIHQAA